MHNYVVYHLHSDYSMLDSCSQFQEYVELAKAQGHTAIASTEHGKTLGWVSKKLMCDEAGIKFIHGVEIYLTESLEPKTRDNYHTILLAKNPDGVRELNRLIELSSRPDHFYYTNRLTFDEFLAISDNIIKISACLASPLNKLEDEHPRYLELARNYDYLEIQPHDCDEQRDFNQRLLALSKSLGKPLIAGTDTHSATPYKAECRALRLKRKNQSYGNEDKFDLTWKTYDDLCEAFQKQGSLPEEEYLEAIENTNRMASSVEPFELDKSIKYPILYGSRERDSEVFTERVESMFRQKLDSGEIPASQKQAFREAIDEEMRVFSQAAHGRLHALHVGAYLLVQRAWIRRRPGERLRRRLPRRLRHRHHRPES